MRRRDLRYLCAPLFTGQVGLTWYAWSNLLGSRLLPGL